MQRDPVESSNIASVGYDQEKETLAIEFRGSGDVWHYYGVPQDLYDRMMAAESKGRFFQRSIRGLYTGSKQ